MNDEELNRQLRAMVDNAAVPLSQTEVVLRASSPARKSRRDWHLTEHRLIVVAVAAAIVVVFFVPLPSLSLFNRLSQGDRAVVPGSSTVPVGWVPVAFGNAQIAVPGSWSVLYDAPDCPIGKGPGELFVNPYETNCNPSAKTPTNWVMLSPLLVFNHKNYKAEVINGITVYNPSPNSGRTPILEVPSLGVSIWAQGPLAQRVLHTLSRSPRTVALASGPAPVVPSSWQSVSFAGLHFSVPADWPINRTQTTPNLGGSDCQAQGAAFFSTVVTLSTDTFPLIVATCLYSPQTLRSPPNAVQVDSGSRWASSAPVSQSKPPVSFSTHCLHLHGLTACPATSPAYSILVLKVAVPGRSKPVYVSIGLAGNGMTARTILYSLRPATTVVTANASMKAFYTLARKGLEEPFQASYRLTYPKGSAKSHFHFQVWSEPEVPNKTQGDFVYQSAFGHGTFRYIRKHGVDYACVQRTAKSLGNASDRMSPIPLGKSCRSNSFDSQCHR